MDGMGNRRASLGGSNQELFFSLSCWLMAHARAKGAVFAAPGGGWLVG
uniref:Uncharacterized protein n=1 Tax=Arundo donax TaxID=35708 RepID=A0A0A9H6V8_ARUDO